MAIALAIRTRQVHLSLLAGVWLGATIVGGGNPLAGMAGAVEAVVAVAAEPSNTRLLFFCLLIGPLVVGMEASGGVAGFVAWLERSGWVRGPRGARLLAWVIGIVVFIESNITLLVTGAVCRPLFDRHGETREKLAYLADSTSAPVCILIPFNAWGALILGLLAGQNLDRPLQVFLAAVPLNFYALTALLLAGLVAWSGWSVGPMRRAGRGAAGQRQVPEAPATAPAGLSSVRLEGGEAPPRAVNMVLPLVVMITMMPFGLYWTGGGVMGEGSGSTSALWAVLAGNLTAAVLILTRRLASLAEVMRLGIRGAESLLGLVLILLLSMTLGEVCQQLGTGPYLAANLGGLAHPVVLLPATFLIGAAIAFATGTSWGTFAMTIPIAVPAAQALGLPVAPFLAACLSGGIFGDHASPVSDTTIVASLAAATDVIDHVRTQLPYALMAAGVTIVLFALTGWML